MKVGISFVFASALFFVPFLSHAGQTGGNDPHANCVCDSQDGGSGGAHGMARYSFMSLLAGLHLVDTPLAYTPPVGRPIDITFTYNQRESDQPASFNYSNVGAKWTFNWLSYIQDDPSSPGNRVLRYVAGGGGRTYTGYNSSTKAFTPETDNAAVLVQMSANPIAYELRFTDGSKDVFSQPDGAATYPRRVFLTSRVDVQGNTVSLNYDDQRRLTVVVDAIGQQTTFVYGDARNPLLITAVVDPFGRNTQLAYDSVDRLVSITDAIGMVSSFDYESASSTFVSALTTAYGTTRFAHTQGVGNWSELSIQATDPDGNTERTEYIHAAPGIPFSEAQVPNMPTFNAYINYRNSYYWDKSAYAAACTVVNGVTKCDYSKARIKHFLHLAPNYSLAARVLESVKSPNESRVWYYYPNPSGWAGGTGSFDQPTHIGRVLDDGTTQLTQYSYNAQGNRTLAIDPVGRRTAYDYAANGIDLVRIRHNTATGFDVLSQWTYNSQHLPLTETDAAGQTTTYTYNAAGQVTSITNPLNETTTFSHDAAGYLISIINAAGNSQATLTYDASGRVAKVTDSEGYVLRYGYDALDRVTSIGYPDSTSEAFVYDKLDVVKHVDRLGRATVYTYDAVRNRTSVTDPLNLTVRYGYFQNGQLQSLTDAKGNTTQWTRDIESRITSKIYPDASAWHYAYDGSGRQKSRTDALGQARQLSYAPDDRIENIRYFNSVNPTPNVSFVHDPYYPRPVSMTDGSGSTQYTYVPAGSPGGNQLASETAPGNNTQIAYTYDALGRLERRTVDSAVEAFNYDVLGRIVGNSNPLGSFTYAYAGQTQQHTTQLLAGGLLRTDWGYQDNAHDRRLQSIAHHGAAPDQMYASIAETGIVQRTDSPGLTQSYTYDADDRLNEVMVTASKDCPSTPNNPNAANRGSNGHDCGLHLGQATHAMQPGNTVALGYVNDAANNLVGIGEGAFGFDFIATVNSNNQIETATFIDADQTYRTDANGNVLEDAARTYQWDAENRLMAITEKASGSTSQFGYDGQSRRIKQIETGGTTPAPVESRFLWCGEHLCQQRDSTDAVTAHYFMQGEQHLSGTPQALYYAQDHLGSVIGTTDQSGATLGSAEYTAYGRTQTQSGTRADFGYAAMYQHGASGLYLTHYRAYDSQTGRWLNRDPIEEAGGINLYSYVGGNPISRTDPLGLACNGLGCWNTPAELGYANAGNYGIYYQAACAGGDSYACAARVVATGEGNSVSALAGARFTNGNLHYSLRRGGSECPDGDMEKIKKDLMNARVASLANASPSNPYRTTSGEISAFHNDIFSRYGATDGWGPFPVFGGDIRVVGNTGGWAWCTAPACQP